VQVGVSKNGQLSGRRRDRPTRSLLLISRQAGPAVGVQRLRPAGLPA